MELQVALSHFLPVSLEEMNGIRLMNRTDTKFVTLVWLTGVETFVGK